MIDLRVDDAELLRTLNIGEHYIDQEGNEQIIIENSENILASILTGGDSLIRGYYGTRQM